MTWPAYRQAADVPQSTYLWSHAQDELLRTALAARTKIRTAAARPPRFPHAGWAAAAPATVRRMLYWRKSVHRSRSLRGPYEVIRAAGYETELPGFFHQMAGSKRRSSGSAPLQGR